ncbi:putative fatty-acid-CoA ligase FadD [Mycobacteroides abscessus subsp. abscessus]|nr:putative fatty-acid-CoA ligase FadD [Mycobacteroides abscessus subsp. abscessus]
MHVVESFPMTVTGKVRKIEMRQQTIQIFGLPEPGRTDEQ